MGSAALLASSAAAAAAPARSLPDSTVVTPEQFGAVGDLRGASGGTDDTQAFRKMAAHLNRTGGRARISRQHRITGGFALFAGTLEFTDQGLIRNTAALPGFSWQHTCLFVGTYFGCGAPTGINADPIFTIAPIEAGADRFTLSAGRAPAQFKRGALVYLKDGRLYPDAQMDLRIATHISTIAAVEGATVIMRDASPFPIGGDTDSPATVVTPSNAIALHPGMGVPAPTTRIAQGVRIINGAFESLLTAELRSQTVHVACHASDLDFRWLVGSHCLGINPCSDSKIAVQNGNCANLLYELAHFHARVESKVIRGRRLAGSTPGGFPMVAIDEYGHSVKVGELTVEDSTDGRASWAPTVGVSTPLTQIDRASIVTRGGIALKSGSMGTRGEGTRIGVVTAKGAETALMVDTDDLSAELVQLREPIGMQPAGVWIRRTAGRQVAIRAVESNYATVRDDRV